MPRGFLARPCGRSCGSAVPERTTSASFCRPHRGCQDLAQPCSEGRIARHRPRSQRSARGLPRGGGDGAVLAAPRARPALPPAAAAFAHRLAGQRRSAAAASPVLNEAPLEELRGAGAPPRRRAPGAGGLDPRPRPRRRTAGCLSRDRDDPPGARRAKPRAAILIRLAFRRGGCRRALATVDLEPGDRLAPRRSPPSSPPALPNPPAPRRLRRRHDPRRAAAASRSSPGRAPADWPHGAVAGGTGAGRLSAARVAPSRPAARRASACRRARRAGGLARGRYRHPDPQPRRSARPLPRQRSGTHLPTNG